MAQTINRERVRISRAVYFTGVIWTPIRSIPGAKEGFDRLRDEGKKVFFVTNNSAQPPHSRLNAIGFAISKVRADSCRTARFENERITPTVRKVPQGRLR